jgi:hypothetical protein
VPGVEDVELAAGQPVVQELGVDRRHRRVAGAGDDLHRRLDLRQQVAQGREFGRVGADVAHRLGHPVTLIRPQVVLADGVGKRVALDADVGPDDVRACEPEGVGSVDDELAHRPRRQQRIAALRMTEPWQVDRHQVRVLGEPRPHRLERQQAFWPRAQQQGVIVMVLALGETDRQPVDDPELIWMGVFSQMITLAWSDRAARARIRHWIVRVASRGRGRVAGQRPV